MRVTGPVTVGPMEAYLALYKAKENSISDKTSKQACEQNKNLN